MDRSNDYQTVVCVGSNIEDLNDSIQIALNDFNDEGYAFNYMSIVNDTQAIIIFIKREASVLINRYSSIN
tara:strand:+ start:67 stop:276 length:210 start_codon:yes stop_codon:yes gene_type:complete